MNDLTYRIIEDLRSTSKGNNNFKQLFAEMEALREYCNTTFADISEEEIRSYISTHEPLFLAGGASLDGIGSPYISRIAGDASGVLGLSMNHLRVLCEELGYPWHTLRAS